MCEAGSRELRCAYHAKKNLQTARRSGSPARIAKAEREYRMSPAYVSDLRTRATALHAERKEDEAAALQQKADRIEQKRAQVRQQVQTDYKKRLFLASHPKTPFPILTEMLENRREAKEVRFACAVNLANGDHEIYSTFYAEDLLGLFSGRRAA